MAINKVLIVFTLTLLTSAKGADLIDISVNIAHSIFYNNSVTTVMWSPNSCDDVTMFLSNYQGLTYRAPLEINDNVREIKITHTRNYKQVVLFISKSNEFENYINLIYEIIIEPIRIILVLTNEDANLTEITNISWKYDIADIFILHNENNTAKIYTYFPYSNGICDDTTPVLLNDVWDIKVVHQNKFKNFQGCPIKITLMHLNPYITYNKVNDTVTSIAGTEAELPFILSYVLNASLEILPASLTVNISNSTNTELFSNVRDRISDIVIPSTVLDVYRYKLSQISYVYNVKIYCWVGPPRRAIETWSKIRHAFFSNSISPFFWTTFAIFVVLLKFIPKCYSLRHKGEKDVLIKAYSIFLGQETKFKTKSALITSLFTMWIWFCVVVRQVFQANLTSGLQNVFLEAPWTSMDDAVNEVEGYGGGLLYKSMLKGSKLENDYQTIEMRGNYTWLQHIAKGKRFIVFADKLVIQLLNLGTDLQYIGSRTYSAPSCLFMRRGWPAAKRINELILRAIESGFVVKATKDEQFKSMITLHLDNTNAVKDPQPLSLNDFKGFIYVYLYLMGICFIVFIIEVIYYKIQSVNNITGN